MSPRGGVRLRSRRVGGIATYPLDKLFQEVGYIAYHFHWSRDELLDLPHPERHRWVKVISEINRKINAVEGGAPGSSGQVAERRPLEPPPPPPGSQRMSPGLALRNDPEAVRRALREHAERRAKKRRES